MRDLIPWNESDTPANQRNRIRENVGRLQEGLEELADVLEDDGSGRALATEEAAELANENGIDIRRVAGTGQDGRILKGDVQTYLDALEEESTEEDSGG